MRFLIADNGIKHTGAGILRSLWPALTVLLLTLIISAFFAKFTLISGLESLWKVLLRFFRLSLVLALPLLLLPNVCTIMHYLLNRGNRHLIQIKKENYIFNPLQNWLLRPLQGIGLAMLIATKLLTLLQISLSTTVNATTILPTGQFNPGRFMGITSIAVITSLLLSFLWTLDNLDIRYFNKKTREVKMIGKYTGLFLPVIFGFYGVFSLFETQSQLLAIYYILQLVIVMYPPFVVMIALHTLYIKKRDAFLISKLRAVIQVRPIETYE